MPRRRKDPPPIFPHTALRALSGREPPQSAEMEQNLLCCCILGGIETVSHCVSAGVKRGAFYLPANGTIYQHLVSLCAKGTAPTLDALIQELREVGELEAVGDVSYLMALTSKIPTSIQFSYYLEKVLELYKLRELIKISIGLHEKCFEYEGTIAEAVAPFVEEIVAIQAGTGAPSHRQMPAIVGEARAWAEAKMRGKESPFRQILTGLSSFDRYATPIEPHEYVVVGARTRHGKTSFLCQIANHNLYKGVRTAFFNLETSDRSIVERIAAQRSGANVKLFDQEPTDKQQRYFEALGELNTQPLLIFDHDLTLEQIEARCRLLANSFKPELVVIDYLNLLGGDSPDSYERITQVSKAMLPLRKRLGCALLVGAQLNRSSEKENRQPQTTDFRDCVAGSQRVLDPKTGKRVRIEDVVAGQNVLAITNDMKLVNDTASSAWAAGKKDVFRVDTTCGNSLVCTNGHRLYTPYGFKRLKHLSVGDTIAVARIIDEPEIFAPISPRAALLLGWMMGDGCFYQAQELTVNSVSDAELACNLAREEFGIKPTYRPESKSDRAWRVTFTAGWPPRPKKNPMTRWIRSLGLYGKTKGNKFTPDVIFEASNPCVAAYLRGLFHADGCCTIKPGGTSVLIKLNSICRHLCEQARDLLLRFGIQSIVSEERNPKQRFGCYHAYWKYSYVLRITRRTDVIKFVESIGFLGEKHKAALIKITPAKHFNGSFDRLPLKVNSIAQEAKHKKKLRGFRWDDQGKKMARENAAMLAGRLDALELAVWAHSDIRWTEIKSINPAGRAECFDLTVPINHSFVVENFVTHNSGSVEEDAHRIVALYRPNKDFAGLEQGPERLVYDYEILQLKLRDGPTTGTHAKFMATCTRFMEEVKKSA